VDAADALVAALEALVEALEALVEAAEAEEAAAAAEAVTPVISDTRTIVPALFLVYIFLSVTLTANSPCTKSPVAGIAEAVELFFVIIVDGII
jgi:uncharacterized membrane protein YgcG